MSYSYLENIELEKALEIYVSKVESITASRLKEEILVKESHGRITAEAVYAITSSPHYEACAMDGIAVKARTTFGATETTPVKLREGVDFERVDTGDPLPERFDAVVMIEDVIELGEGMAKLLNSVTPRQHVRQIGEDLCAAEMIVPSNTKIEAQTMGAMLAGGVSRIKVWKKPLVGLIPTGDEIIPPTESREKGKIIEFNSTVFSAMLADWGVDSKVYDIVPDSFRLICEALQKAAAECDVIILNGGASAGRDDYSARAISKIGEIIVHGIAIRPGKPTILGLVCNKPVIGIPGYPVSGIIVMEKLVKRILQSLWGLNSPERPRIKATLSKKILSSLKYKEFLRMKLGNVDGRFIATPLHRGAGVITSYVKADGLLEVPLNTEGYEAGQEIEVELLKSEEEIKNTLVVTGSHDLSIDIIDDLMRKEYIDKYISSAHVGSIGGIMAIKRGEAHVAGIHLLDEETGTYNTTFIKKYFANEKIYLIRGLRRIQGLMVAANNPKNIKGLEDLVKEGIRYVNRQKGSGTRILLDYLLKKYGILGNDIYGYEREEFTHISVAAAVSSGSADAGMGIYTAAKIYGLHFIPLWEEQYDFIIPERFAELDIVRCFIKILQGREFRAQVCNIGGYLIENPGEIQVLD